VILLDTDITIDILRQHPPAVNWLSQNMHEEFFLPGIVVMELLQGSFNKQELNRVLDFVKPFPILWLSSEESDTALEVFAKGRLSHNLGLLDALIGQLAISLGVPLYTFNQKHFTAIPTLKTVQPYTR
jgi:predicted nucleic acid-binding protein